MRRWRTVRCLFFLAAILAFQAGGVAAQDSARDRLVSTVGSLAQAWAVGAEAVVVTHLRSERIALSLEGEAAASLPLRHATVAVREYMRGFEQGEARVVRAELAGDGGGSGFAELRWSARRVGTGQRLEYTVFLGMRQDGAGWMVEEIRVMR